MKGDTKMNIFLDSANWQEIEEAASWGILSGVTTNPSLVAKEKGISFPELIKKIALLIPGPISAEVTSLTARDMVNEGLELSKIAPNVVIKIPAILEGLQAVKELTDKKITTNVTLVFSASQALLAAKAGATYVSPFIGRLDDHGENGIQVVSEIASIFRIHQIPTQIIAASIRSASHVTDAALVGAHNATIPFEILKSLIHHPLTDDGLEKFLADWQKK